MINEQEFQTHVYLLMELLNEGEEIIDLRFADFLELKYLLRREPKSEVV